MTIICAYRAPNGAMWIAADTVTTDGRVRQDGQHKWWSASGRWIGVSGDRNLGNLISEHVDSLLADPCSPGLVRDRLLALIEQQCGEWTPSKDDLFPNFGATMILVLDGKIYDFDSYWSYTLHNEGFVARGTGREIAMGAAYACLYPHDLLPPDTALYRIVHAAIDMASGCGGMAWVHQVAPPPH